MIIECSGCGARFQMKESILEGYRGAQVRCRRCSETIIVEKTGASPPRPRPGTTPAESRTPPRKAPAAAHARPKTAPAENHARPRTVPDNVYSIARFRENAARKPVAADFDISGRLRPEPEGVSDVRIPVAAAFAVAGHQEAARTQIQPTLLEEPVPRPAERTAALKPDPVGNQAPRRRFGFRRRSRGDAGASHRGFPRPWHIAIVYFFLLVLGGFAFLLVQFLASPGFYRH